MEFWDIPSCLQLIAEYKTHEVLWNPKNKYRYNTIKKDAAWKQIADSMNADVDIIKKKIDSLRGSYRRERSKIIKRNGDFKSPWFAYESMRFLDCDNKKYQANSPENHVDNDSSIENGNSSVLVTMIKREKGTQPMVRPLRKKSAFGSVSPRLAPSPLRRIKIGDDNGTRTGDSSDGTLAADGSRDECSIYGELVANKLRRLDERSRALVQHQLNNTLFEAEMKYLFSRGPSFPFDHVAHIIDSAITNSTCTQTSASASTSPNSQSPSHTHEREQFFMSTDIKDLKC